MQCQYLPHELNQYPRRDQCRNDFIQREEAERNGEGSHGENGDVWEAGGGMKPGKNAEEIAIERGGIGDTRVTQQKHEYGSEGCPENQDSQQSSCARAVDSLHEIGGDEFRMHRFAPRDDRDDADVHDEIDRRYGQDGPDYRTRNRARRIANFAGYVTDTVVAHVVAHEQISI